ncbi:MAG: hypothetical protein HFG28_10080 [Eubacterium sp.]|nr:hypothetical protein [Eubacterium sp.]
MLTGLKKIANLCFYMGVVIEVLIVIIDKSAFINPIEGRLLQFTFLLFLVKICLTKYSWREYVTIFGFCALGVISYFVSGRNEIIRLVVFIAACKGIDMDKCLKLVFYLTLIGCAMLMLFSVIGILGTVSLTQDYGRGKVETRYTLGLGHPNALQCMVWALTTLGLYLYGNGMKWHHYLITFVINTVFFGFTDSKTSFLVTSITIVLAYLMSERCSANIQKIGVWLGGIITFFSIGISVVIAGNAYKVYNYVWYIDRSPIAAFYARLNDILNGRIRILVENDGFEGTIATWRIFSRPENNYYFDMGWIRLFYWYGIIPACVFIGVIFVLMLYCYKKGHYLSIMLISSFAFYSIIEAHAISVYIARNYIFFLIGMYWSPIICNKEKG